MLMPRSTIPGRFAVMTLMNLLAAGCDFLLFTLIARQLGSEPLGMIAISLSLVGYAVVVSTFGSTFYAITTVAADRNRLGRMMSEMALLRLLLSLPCYCLLLTIVVTIPGFHDVSIIVAVLGLLLFTNSVSMAWVPQALHQSHVFSFSNLAVRVLNLVLGISVLYFSPDLIWLVSATVLSEAIVAACLLAWIHCCIARFEPPGTWRSLLRLARSFAPLGGSQLSRAAALGSDLIVLGLMTSREETGYYAAAFKIFMFLLSLATAYFVIILPRLSESGRGSRQVLRREVRASLRQTIPLTAVGVALLAILSPVVMELLFGRSFSAAAPALAILSVALLANVLARQFRQVLLVGGLHHADFQSSLASTMVHIGAKVAFTALWGITGTALGTLFGELVLLAWQRKVANRYLSQAS